MSRKDGAGGATPAVSLRPDFAAAVTALYRESPALRSCPPLGEHEVVLLHGTKPASLHNILFKGLDPGLAGRGLFGSGTYLAEDAAKVDQYLAIDSQWRGSASAHELHALHSKLYSYGVKHAGDVAYALVCRVQLGNAPSVTRNGVTDVDGAPLFADARCSSLARSGAHALIAETGGLVERFREFVVFDPDAVSIAFVVALKRVRSLCDCEEPEPLDPRTVNSGVNKGRPVLFCRKERDDPRNCGFVAVLPQCYCGNMCAGSATTQKGDVYYRCGKRFGNRCDFLFFGTPAHWTAGVTASRAAGLSSPERAAISAGSPCGGSRGSVAALSPGAGGGAGAGACAPATQPRKRAHEDMEGGGCDPPPIKRLVGDREDAGEEPATGATL